MTEHDSTLSPYTGNHPLALDTWRPIHDMDELGNVIQVKKSSYQMALETVEQQVSILSGENRRALALRALLATVTDQAARNNQGSIIEHLPERYHAAAYGNGSQACMIQMLHDFPAIGALEIARKTHVEIWNVQDGTDRPVRASIDTIDGTRRLGTRPRYKPKLFDENGVMVERKRTIRSHYNGEILTIIRNCMLIDYGTPDMPTELYDYLQEQQQQALSTDKSDATEYDYSNESQPLREHIETYIGKQRGVNEPQKPEWAVPLLTTYYSTLADRTKHTI